ncbi:MAG: hypothetical protein KDM91_04190 [Verrucomicrobiae bacterium]|nr:hypothetical protein [Verrucomicrobiae bacterium]
MKTIAPPLKEKEAEREPSWERYESALFGTSATFPDSADADFAGSEFVAHSDGHTYPPGHEDGHGDEPGGGSVHSDGGNTHDDDGGSGGHGGGGHHNDS